MFDALLESAAQIIVRHAPHHGVFPTLVPGLTLYRIESNAFIERTAGEIMTTFIVHGRKTTAIGGKMLEYGAGESLVCGIASPSEFHTLDASRDNPFLALSVSLDASILMEYADAWSIGIIPENFQKCPAVYSSFVRTRICETCSCDC